MSLSIRAAHTSDAHNIADFNVGLAAESEGISLCPDTVLQGVTRALEDGLGAQYWVAEFDGSVVGQLMTTREWSDWQNGWYIWLQSVFVVPEHRKKGIFRGLLQHVLQNAASAEDVYSIRLYVDEDNESALETYAKLGFTHTGYQVLEQRVQESDQNP